MLNQILDTISFILEKLAQINEKLLNQIHDLTTNLRNQNFDESNQNNLNEKMKNNLLSLLISPILWLIVVLIYLYVN